jgi:hypothetical protein
VVDYLSRDVDSVRELARALQAARTPGPLPHPLPDEPSMPTSYRDRYSEVFGAVMTIDQQVATLARLKFDIETHNRETEALDVLRVLADRVDLAWRLHGEVVELAHDPRDAPRHDVHGHPCARSWTRCRGRSTSRSPQSRRTVSWASANTMT